jgi:hypothetical protein
VPSRFLSENLSRNERVAVKFDQVDSQGRISEQAAA